MKSQIYWATVYDFYFITLQHHFRFFFHIHFSNFSGLSAIYRAVAWFPPHYSIIHSAMKFDFERTHFIHIRTNATPAHSTVPSATVAISFILHRRINYTSYAGVFSHACVCTVRRAGLFAKFESIHGVCLLTGLVGFCKRITFYFQWIHQYCTQLLKTIRARCTNV